MKLIYFYRLALIFALLFHVQRLSLIDYMEKKPNMICCKITNKYCKKNGGSSIEVKYDNNEKWIEVPRKICLNTNIGNNINLNYNEKYDFFYISNHNIYCRQFFGILILLIMSFINWGELRNKMGLK